MGGDRTAVQRHDAMLHEVLVQRRHVSSMCLMKASDPAISSSQQGSRTTRSVCDPHHAAEPSIAPRNHYPAIDVFADGQAG